MPLECQLPLSELQEAFCDLDLAPDDDVVKAVLHLVEEAIEFARLLATLQKNNVRLIGVDFSSYPFKESTDFLKTASVETHPSGSGAFEKWSLPLQKNVIDELQTMAHIFNVEAERPDLVVTAALRLNRLFNIFLRETAQSDHVVGIRGLMPNVYSCLTSRPLNYNYALRRRLRAPIESFAAKVYDDDDKASIMRFEVGYDDLALVKVIDRDDKERALQFGWDSLLLPPYHMIQGVSWGNTERSINQKFRKLDCMIPRKVSPIAFPSRQQPDSEEFTQIALTILDDTLCFMRKFELLKQHNLKLTLVNTYRTPHEIYDEDFAERIARELNILISFDAYLEKYIAEQNKNSMPYDEEGCRYYCETQLEDRQYEQIKIQLQLPEHIINELNKFAQYIAVPEERTDLVVAGLILLFDSARGTLHEQRINALTKKESGYRIALRGEQNDIDRFQSEYQWAELDFGNARIVESGKSPQVMKAWPLNAPRPVDMPVYLEIC
ncbi:MAG: hypothetical protein JST89_01190 [Cyanobacteria bacterium SZAS-4]|nr:hypothetical protein [Cyanobacteria bacterium SZAS-4]